MEILAHFLDGQTKDMAIEMLNPSVEREYISMFQMEGAQIFTPLINHIKGPNKFTNKNTQTFQYVSLHKGLI